MNAVLLCWWACLAAVAVDAQQFGPIESNDTSNATQLRGENWEQTVSMLRNQLFSECGLAAEDRALLVR